MKSKIFVGSFIIGLYMFVIGCTKHTIVDPVPINEIISSYIVNGVLDVERFNKDNFQYMKIIPVKNNNDSLEFILSYSNSEEIEYYKNGEVIIYTPKNNEK